MSLDESLVSAVERTAIDLVQRASLKGGPDKLTEVIDLQPVFRSALQVEFGDRVRHTSLKLPLESWKPTPGPVDVLVDADADGHELLAELKWCKHGAHELGWTLWDIFKMVSSDLQYKPIGSYALVGAPDTYWEDSSIDCADLFADGHWRSEELFAKYWRAWLDLLHGGSARPRWVPDQIATELIVDRRLETTPPWSLRLIKVTSATEKELPFEGGWPSGLARCDRSDGGSLDEAERVEGCLLGGAVGDALGAPVEFLSVAEIHATFGPEGISDYASAFGRVGAITDDTQMTLFTAEGLMRAQNRAVSKGICSPPDVVWYAYLRWLHTQGFAEPAPLMEIGGLDGWLVHVSGMHSRRAPGQTCLAALEAGSPGHINRPLNDSKGCGGVMRAAPAGILPFGDPFDAGCAVAALTHGHPSGYLAAGFLAAVVSNVMRGEPLWSAATEAFHQLKSKPNSAECRASVENALNLAINAGDPTPDKLASLGEGWVAEEAIAIALYCALTAESFADGVRRAVNHDGDSDSTGAITGNLLGAIFGPRRIPESWLTKLELRDTIETMAADLVRHVRRENFSTPEGAWPQLVEGEWERYPGW